MIEVFVSKIKVDELSEEQVVFLKEKQGNRILPLVIGVTEINAIKIKLSGFQVPRPLTHDLLLKITEALQAQVEKIVIERIEEGTFYAQIVLRSISGKKLNVDARPSDSIALALRASAPIFVTEQVFNAAGIPPK